MLRGALEGMRVVEASAFVAAPLGGMTLAQMGADVIRIDGLKGGLDYRRWPVADNGTSLFWCGLNKGKRSVALDITTVEGRELAMAIISAPGKDAGMLLTNFPPRGWLAYDALSARRPDLVQLTIQGDRHGGSAVDYTVNPAIGLPFLTGPEHHDGVVNHVLPAWDLVTGQMAAVGLLAAERHRHRSGTGQHVRLALEDVALAVMGHLGFLAEAGLGRERERVGNFLYGAFGCDFETADGERVMVVGLTMKQWQALVDATGLQHDIDALALKAGLDFRREGDRYQARHQLAELMTPWFLSRSLPVVNEVLTAHGVCWSLYRSVRRMLAESPSCSTVNPMFSNVHQPGVGPVLTPSIPLDFSAMARVAPKAAPSLGQHTEEVLCELVGLSTAEFGRLHDRGVVGTPSRD